MYFFTAHAHNGHISISGLTSDVTIVFLDPDFLLDAGSSSQYKGNKGNIAYFFTAHARNGHISASVFNCFFIGKTKSPPYFYFRFICPTDLESVPRVEPPTLIISIKF